MLCLALLPQGATVVVTEAHERMSRPPASALSLLSLYHLASALSLLSFITLKVKAHIPRDRSKRRAAAR